MKKVLIAVLVIAVLWGGIFYVNILITDPVLDW